MLTSQDKEQLAKKGISEAQIAEQLKCFETGFPFLKLEAAASIGQGVIAPEQETYLAAWEEYKKGDGNILKFVPASGAASRMFKNLFEFLGGENDAPTSDFEKKFFDNITKFAFYEDLNSTCINNNGKGIDDYY